MNNDILSTLNKILSDENSTKLISGIVSSLSKNENTDNLIQDNNTNTVTNEKSKDIQKKIDVLYALVPLFDEENKKKIEKIINALKIIKMMLTLT